MTARVNPYAQPRTAPPPTRRRPLVEQRDPEQAANPTLAAFANEYANEVITITRAGQSRKRTRHSYAFDWVGEFLHPERGIKMQAYISEAIYRQMRNAGYIPADGGACEVPAILRYANTYGGQLFVSDILPPAAHTQPDTQVIKEPVSQMPEPNDQTTKVQLYVYHPTAGAKVSLLFDNAANPAAALEWVNQVFAAGWLAEPPDHEDSDRIHIVAVVRGQVENDGVTTDRLYFYEESDKLEYKSVTHYLNTDEERAAFEAASGLIVDKLPLWSSSAAPKKTERAYKEFAKACNFVCFRKQVAIRHPKEGQPDYKWVITGYVGDTPPAPAPQPVDAAQAKATLGNGSKSRTITQPAQPPAPDLAEVFPIPADDAPTPEDTSETLNAVQVEIREAKNQSLYLYLHLEDDAGRRRGAVNLFSRDLFRQAGYTVDAWETKGKKFPITPPARVTTIRNGRGRDVVAITKPPEFIDTMGESAL